MAVLFDAYGRYVDMEALRREEAGPTLTGVRQALSDHPAQGLTPARLARLLLEAEQGSAESYLELAEEMEEKDLHYASVISTRKRAVSGLEITVEAASDNPEDVDAAEVVRELVLNRDDLREEIFHIQDSIGKGYSATEIIWNTGGGVWRPERLLWCDPRFFEFDRLGKNLSLKTDNGLSPLSAYKFIVHKSNAKSGLPIRGGLARAASWCYLFKNYDIKNWVRFLEVFGLPLRLGKYGAGATAADKQTLLKAVRNISSDAAAIIPENMMIEFVHGQASGEGTNSFLVFAEYIDKQISKLVLGQTGTTDTGQYVGTSDAHREVRDDIEVSDAVQLTATLNRDIVRPLVDLNLGPRKLYPRLKIAREKREDVTALIQNLTAMVPLGLKVEASVIRDKLGLPEPADDAEILTAPAAEAMPGMWGPPDATPSVVEHDEPEPEKETEVEAVSPTVALNGAQVAAMIQVVQQVAASLLPRDSGLSILTAAFGLSTDEAEAVMGAAGLGFTVEDKAMNRADTWAAAQADESADDWQPLTGPALEAVFALAAKCENFEEFQRGLLELMEGGGLDMSALGEDLAGQMFLATLSGMGLK